MGVKEKDLQTIESLSEGDKLRVVTQEGNSRNIDASTIVGETGYNYSEEYQTIFNDTVTTSGKDEYNPAVNNDILLSQSFDEDPFPSTLKVTFNNVEYICPAYNVDDYNAYYGSQPKNVSEWDWSEYPFYITLSNTGSYATIGTENNGTYQVKIENLTEIIETSDHFEKVINSIAAPAPLILKEKQSYDETTETYSWLIDTTPDQIINAFNTGRPIAVILRYSCYSPLVCFYLVSTCSGGTYRIYVNENGNSIDTLKTTVFEANKNTEYKFVRIES